MSTWFYYDEKGEKIEVTGGRLKGLAKAGLIMPETIVETEDGKKAPAKKVKGLTFGTPGSTPSATAPPESAKPIKAKIYGVVAPPPKPSPFTATMPETENTPVATPSETDNPFTATMLTVTKSVDNPFTITMPRSTHSFAITQPVSVNPLATALTIVICGPIAAICVPLFLWSFVNFCASWYDSGDLWVELQRNYMALLVPALPGCTACWLLIRRLLQCARR